jgi:hypothetical protein
LHVGRHDVRVENAWFKDGGELLGPGSERNAIRLETGIGKSGPATQYVNKEAIQTRDYCVAKSATHHADRADPSWGKKRPPQDDNQFKLIHAVN